MHRFILWLIPTVEKFPRSQKFLLGDRIQAIAFEVLDLRRSVTAWSTMWHPPWLFARSGGRGASV